MLDLLPPVGPTGIINCTAAPDGITTVSAVTPPILAPEIDGLGVCAGKAIDGGLEAGVAAAVGTPVKGHELSNNGKGKVM